MWWYVVADALNVLSVTNIGVTIAPVQNKKTDKSEQFTFVTFDVARLHSRSNYRVSVIVAVENECNGAPEDMDLCHMEDNFLTSWHKHVTLKENNQHLVNTCTVYDYDSLAMSNLALLECKNPSELKNWMLAATKIKRCRFVVCSFSPPMESYLVGFGWLQPLKAPKRLSIPWSIPTINSISICAGLVNGFDFGPESIGSTRRCRKGLCDLVGKHVFVCPADTGAVVPLSANFDFERKDFQCTQLTQERQFSIIL